MSEEKDNLPKADGTEEIINETLESPQPETPADNLEIADPIKPEEVTEVVADSLENVEETVEAEVETPQATEAVEKTAETVEDVETTEAVAPLKESKTTEEETPSDEAMQEIEASNAEDAEDSNNEARHTIEKKDYHSMSLEELVDEFEVLLKHPNVQAIKGHVNELRNEFSEKFNALIDEKKQAFVEEGGNAIDFHYASPARSRFNQNYRDYKSRLTTYYNNLEKNLKSNLANRLEIIEEIKGLLNVEENINTTYKHFKDLQERWRNAGPIPRDKYNNAWNSYHHHVERFYDFLHLNRELRDLDFKHNLDQKLKIIQRAEELAADNDVNRSFRELQALHKLWKEELGPVAREHRDEIWDRFSAATKSIHDKRQVYFAELDQVYEKNLEVKHDIINSIDELTANNDSNHSTWQKKIKKIEVLRQEFFSAGKVPIKVNEATWAKFKESVRAFNRKKNSFYKGLKKDQYDNLKKKLDLIQVAEDNKDSDDFETTTALMKKIQSDWKKIGHVPRKDSDKIWNKFKTACNAYFDRFHAAKNAVSEEEQVALDAKSALLEEVKAIELKGNKDEDLPIIKDAIAKWKSLGRVPRNKGFIEGKFNKAIDALFGKLDMDKAASEMLKYDNRLSGLADNQRMLDKEIHFVRKRIDETKSEINQLENNLQFFSNVDDKNPLVRDVHNNIAKHKQTLEVWQTKYKKLKSMYS